MIAKSEIKFKVDPENLKRPNGDQLVMAKLVQSHIIRLDADAIAVHRDEAVRRAKLVCAIHVWREIYGDELRFKLHELRHAAMLAWRPGLGMDDPVLAKIEEILKLLGDPVDEDVPK